MLISRHLAQKAFIAISLLWLIAPTVLSRESAATDDRQHTPMQVNYQREGFFGQYYSSLLKLALEHTVPTHGPYAIEEVPIARTTVQHLRLKMQNKRNDINVMWSTSTPEREQNFRAVPFDLLRSLNDYRFLLVKKENLLKFSQLKNIATLKQHVAGSGMHWSDTKVLRLNQLPVETSRNTHLLYRMLDADRFDYMTRGAYEIGSEIKHYNKSFALVPNIVLNYTSKHYFFVHKDNKALADRLLAGLLAIEKNGQLDTLFFSIPSFNYGWQAIHADGMTIIPLKSIEGRYPGPS